MIGTLGHFNLLEEVGVGGLGRVYRARDTVHGRTVLIKVAPAELAEPGTRRDRFLAAARAASALSHPNLATLFDIGESDNSIYLIIEYVPGETLGQATARGPQHVRTAVDIGIQLADALAEVHGHGLVHGDLRPETVRVNPKGNAKLLESGLTPWTRGGRLRHLSAALAETDTALAIETVAYCSPEQANGESVDERSDLFSLGVVLYEMLTGSLAFHKSSVAATIANVQSGSPRPPSDINPDVPEELDELVRRAIAKSTDDRFQSAASFAAELRGIAAILDIRSGDSEPSARVESPRARRGRGRRGGGVQAALALVGVGALVWWLAGDLVRQTVGPWFGPPPAPVLAVLPLDFDESGARYFADGVSEDLAVRLGQIPGVSVVGRAGMRGRRGAEAAAIGAELGTGAVMRGSVRTNDQGIELDLELIDSADGGSVWHARRSGPFETVLATQTEVAEAIAEALHIDLGPSAARARKKSTLVSEGAYDLYLRGRDAVAMRDTARAIELYESAIREGDGFAELYAALAYALYVESASLPDDMKLERLAEVAALAAASDPDLPQAQVARGLAAASRGEALTYFRRAVELDRSYALPYAMIANWLAVVVPELSRRFDERARALDPTRAGDRIEAPSVRESAEAPELGGTERQLLEDLLREDLAGTSG